MPDQLDTRVLLNAGHPSGPFGPDWGAIYASQNQAYRGALQQQDLAGQNVLKGLFANQNMLNPATGLPSTQAIGQVGQVDPNLALSYVAATQKISDERTRQQANQMLIGHKTNGLIDQYVGTPLINYAQSPEVQKLPEDQRKVVIEQKRQELMKDVQKSQGLTDTTTARYDRPYDPVTWPLMSEGYKKRQEDIIKGWDKEKHYDFSTDPPTEYAVNNFLGITTLPDHKTPYTPTSYKDPTKSPQPVSASKFVPAKVTDDQGNVTNQQVLVRGDRITTPDNKTLNPDNVEIQPKASKGTTSTEKMIGVKTEGGGTEYIPAQVMPPEAGKPLVAYDKQGKQIDPDRIVKVGVSAAESSKTPYTEAATNMIVGQLMTGDPSALKNAWRDKDSRIHLQNALADKAEELWGYKPKEDESEDSVKRNKKAAQEASGANLSALNAMFSGQEGALKSLDKLRSNVENFEQTALRNADKVESLMEKGLAGGQSPLLNKWINVGRRQIKGDADLVALDNAIIDLKNEYAKIMSSPGATGAVTSDHARDEAATLINSAMSPEGIKSAIKTMREVMRNRIDSINEQIKNTISEIKTGGGITSPLTEPETAPKSSGAKPNQSSNTAPIPQVGKGIIHDKMDDAIAAMKASPDKRFRLRNTETGQEEVWEKDSGGTPKKVR